jgi:hypothetical protein
LLGYHFEESLHDASLDKFVQPFRDTYPLSVPVTDPTGVQPASATSAPNVVDGLALQDANAAHKLDVDGTWGNGLPSMHDDQVAVAAILAHVHLAQSRRLPSRFRVHESRQASERRDDE